MGVSTEVSAWRVQILVGEAQPLQVRPVDDLADRPEGPRRGDGYDATANHRPITASGIKALSWLFYPADRPEGRRQMKKVTTMNTTKKFGFATLAATGFAAALVGLAAPAQAVTTAAVPAAVSSVTVPAGVDHFGWLYDIQPHANAPHVSTTVQQSR
jgi:hypothetical protein